VTRKPLRRIPTPADRLVLVLAGYLPCLGACHTRPSWPAVAPIAILDAARLDISTQEPAANERTPRDPATPPAAAGSTAPATPPATPTSSSRDHSGRFSYGILAGVEFSQRRESFSRADPYVEFSGDTAWRSLDTFCECPQEDFLALAPEDFHTWIGLSLQATPVEATDVATSEKFIASRKVFQGMVGADWRLVTFQDTERRIDGKQQRMRTFLGPTARIGLQTLDTPDTDATTSFAIDDRTARHWGLGLKMGDHPAEQLDTHDINPGVRRYLAVYYGQYETFDKHKWTVEGLLQTDQDPGLFVGFTAVLGDGPDDITIWLGMSFGVDRLGQALRSLLPSGLLGGGT
jgi:hypothetical protein